MLNQLLSWPALSHRSSDWHDCLVQGWAQWSWSLDGNSMEALGTAAAITTLNHVAASAINEHASPHDHKSFYADDFVLPCDYVSFCSLLRSAVKNSMLLISWSKWNMMETEVMMKLEVGLCTVSVSSVVTFVWTTGNARFVFGEHRWTMVNHGEPHTLGNSSPRILRQSWQEHSELNLSTMNRWITMSLLTINYITIIVPTDSESMNKIPFISN